MIAAGRILPILDGLDEMAREHHAAAITGVSDALSPGQQLVLTSRTVAYENAVRTAGPMARTPVVEIQSLAMTDVAAYLTDGTEQLGTRWDIVTHHLRTSTGTPLTDALASPLMVWLARVVYRHHTTDPTELVTAVWASTRLGLEQRLLSGSSPPPTPPPSAYIHPEPPSRLSRPSAG